MTTLFASHARLPSGLARDVLIEVAGGRFTSVTPDASARPDAGRPRAVSLPGVVLPGFANAHSHAFHRALRGRTHAGGGTFWTWRDAMYTLASHLDPDNYLALARAVYAEMALAGITTVGEFHYVLLAATAADIDSVWADGAPVVSGGAHRLGDVARLLSDAIGGLWEGS
jgi:cytosine/adenosine deaminase-related metal-dependent hydrolase